MLSTESRSLEDYTSLRQYLASSVIPCPMDRSDHVRGCVYAILLVYLHLKSSYLLNHSGVHCSRGRWGQGGTVRRLVFEAYFRWRSIRYGTVYGFQRSEQLPYVGCYAVHAKPGNEFVSTFAIAF